jgi:hypothetical protein
VKVGFNGNATTDCVVASATVADCAVAQPTAGATALAVVVAD